MPAARRYQLLCPIARALDRVGDRWALLILRDLHAGPARYSELAAGLPGAASNLLAGRLQQLIADRLVQKSEAAHGVAVYELTKQGERTAPLLFELARFGAGFEPDETLRTPGNHRSIAVTLKAALERTAPLEAELNASLTVGEDAFEILLKNGVATVRVAVAPQALIRFKTDFETLSAASDGRMPLDVFASRHLVVETDDPDALPSAMRLMGGALAEIASASRD